MLLQDVPHLFFSGLGRGPLDWKLVSIVLVFMKDKKNCGNNRTGFFFFFSSVPGKIVKIILGLEHKMSVEHLRSLDLFSLEQTEGGPHGGLQFPQEMTGGQHVNLISLLTVTEPKTAWSCISRGSDWILGKCSSL